MCVYQHSSVCRYIEQQQQLWTNHCNTLPSQNSDGEDQRWSKGDGKSPQKSPTGSLDRLPITAPDLLTTMVGIVPT